MDPLTRALLAGLDPLLDAASDPAGLHRLLAEVGIELPTVDLLRPGGPLDGLLEPLGALASQVDSVRTTLAGPVELDEALALVLSVPGLASDVLAVARALEQAPELLAKADVPDELRDPATWTAALGRMPGVLLAQGLQQESPGLYLVLRALGVIDVSSTASAGELRWSGLPGAVADPASALGAARGRVAVPPPGMPEHSLLPMGAILDARSPLRIREAAIPDAGLRLDRRYQRARSADGRIHLWLGRRVRTGAWPARGRFVADRLRREAPEPG